MFKVLVVEDEDLWQRMIAEELAGWAVVLPALTISEAEKVVIAHHDLDAIVMDACVPGHRPTTPELVRRIRGEHRFGGPMIASSSSREYRRQLMLHGCDHQADKLDVPAKVREVIRHKRAS